jgi:UDP:flavonoid glycosyltransferase YjiC (YdhE family)
MGTRGDVYPLIAIGRALRQRGHRVTIATTDDYRPIVYEGGLKHHTLRPDPSLGDENPLMRGVRRSDRNPELAVRKVIYPGVEDTFRDLLSAAHDADLLAFPMFIFPGPMAAERLRIPWVVMHSAPATLYSDYDPPYIPHVSWLYRLQRLSPVVPRLFNPIARFAIRSWSAPLHALRAREGFVREKREYLLGGMRSPWLNLGLFSRCIGAEQPDWPKPCFATGFPFLEEHFGHTEEAIERFLRAGEAPLIGTLGSVVSETRLDFLKNLVKAAARLGQRLLLIAGADADYLRRVTSYPNLFVVDYAPYSWIFPRSSALIISGSIGPVGHALRAGRPMLAVAAEEGADQPDNALRASRLGVARWMHLRRGTAERIEVHLRHLLSDPDYARNAECIAQQVRAEDGAIRACEELEAVVADAGGPRRLGN